MSRWVPAAMTIAVIVAVAAVIEFLPWPPASVSRDRPSASQTPTGEAPARSLEKQITVSALRFALPARWASSYGASLVNRAIERQFWSGTHDIEPPSPSARWSNVPTDTVVVELWEFAGPPRIPGPDQAAEEVTFPLSWSTADRSVDADGFEVRQLRFQYFLHPLAFIAHIGKDASALDRAALDRMLTTMRAEPIPDSGIHLGLYVVGRLDDIAVGGVRHVDINARSGPSGLYLVRGSHHLFAHWDEGLIGHGALRPCPIRFEESLRMFTCDRTGDLWARVGTPLSLGDPFALNWAPAVTRDGKILVAGSRIGGPLQRDETVEFGAVTVAAPAKKLSRAEMITRAIALSSASQAREVDAKLLDPAVLGRSSIFLGMRSVSPVWVVQVRGEVRIGGQISGQWTLFAFDEFGKLLTASCCGPGVTAAGFDELPE